jgi:hypothetical protein
MTSELCVLRETLFDFPLGCPLQWLMHGYPLCRCQWQAGEGSFFILRTCGRGVSLA